jgi:Tfp pilus assembly protein PilN
MRELEFMPAWYPQMRRRRRMVVIQAWATFMVIFALGTWAYLARQNVNNRQAFHDDVARQLDQSRAELKELNAQLAEKDKLEAQQKILSKLGLHVEASRMLDRIASLMPREMSLTEATFDTLEQTRQRDNRSDSPPEVTRKLQVRVVGLTPSDADWAGVLAKLSAVPYFQDVRLVGAKDRNGDAHLMREFEVSFVVDLGSGG